jgi:hypothetical protein
VLEYLDAREAMDARGAGAAEAEEFGEGFARGLADEALFNVILVANYLDIKELADVSVGATVRQIGPRRPPDVWVPD